MKIIRKKGRPTKKIVLLDWDFQFRIIKLSILVGLISTAVSCFVILWPLYKFEILRIPRFLPTPILVAMIVALLTNIFSLGIMGFYLSHRISGPLYSVVRKLRLLGHGNFYGHLHLRKNDELKYLMRNVNNVTTQLSNRTKEHIEVLEGIHKDFDSQISQQGSGKIKDQIHHLITELKKAVKEKEEA